MESKSFSTFLVNALDNRTDFGDLGKQICRANILDINNNRLDKILLITCYQLNVHSGTKELNFNKELCKTCLY